MPFPVLVFVEQGGSGDIRRHQVRRELYPGEIEGHGFGKTVDHQCLRQSRHPLDHHVSPGKKCGEDLADDVHLANNDFPDFRRD